MTTKQRFALPPPPHRAGKRKPREEKKGTDGRASNGGHNRIDFDEDQIEQIFVMSGFGMPLKQIAAVLGVSEPTLDRMIDSDPRIADAIAKGSAEASANVRQTAYKMATSGKWPAMTIFWLKVRERWREPRFEDDDSTDAPLTLAYKK